MKFKNHLILLISLATIPEIFAQKNTAVLSVHGSVGVGTLLGNTANFYYVDGRAPRGTIDFAATYSAGLNAGYMFNKWIGVTSGIVYDNAAWQYNTVGNLRKSKTTSQKRVQVPLLLRFEKLSRRKRGGYFFHLGANVSFLQSIKDNINGPIQASVESEFNRVTLAAQGDAGAFAPINKTLWLIVGMQTHQQFSNNFNRAEMKGYLSSIHFFAGLSLRH